MLYKKKLKQKFLKFIFKQPVNYAEQHNLADNFNQQTTNLADNRPVVVVDPKQHTSVVSGNSDLVQKDLGLRNNLRNQNEQQQHQHIAGNSDNKDKTESSSSSSSNKWSTGSSWSNTRPYQQVNNKFNFFQKKIFTNFCLKGIPQIIKLGRFWSNSTC